MSARTLARTRGLVRRRERSSHNNGKVAIDSNAAISAIITGVHKKLARRCNAKTPFPPGLFIDSCNTEVGKADAAPDFMASPSQYSKLTAADPAHDYSLTKEQTENYVVSQTTIDELESKLFYHCLAHVADLRISKGFAAYLF